MIGKGGKGYYVGGQDREWLSCLKSHLQQHKPNNASPNDTSHHIPPTTHHTPHSPKFDVRQARGGKAKGLLATPGGGQETGPAVLGAYLGSLATTLYCFFLYI